MVTAEVEKRTRGERKSTWKLHIVAARALDDTPLRLDADGLSLP